MEELNDLVNEIIETVDRFKVNATLNLKGNKAAGVRARKATLALEKLFKQFRKESVK